MECLQNKKEALDQQIKNMDELSGKVRENADRRRLLEEKQQKLKDLEALLVQAKADMDRAGEEAECCEKLGRTIEEYKQKLVLFEKYRKLVCRRKRSTRIWKKRFRKSSRMNRDEQNWRENCSRKKRP